MAARKRDDSKRHPVAGAAGVAVVALGAGLLLFQAWPGVSAQTGLARYVGSVACASCHTAQSGEWQESQHRASMAIASTRSVLGNFDNSSFSHAGVTSTFFRRDGDFFVRTDDSNGALADFQVKYTLGVYPLQQYLIEFPDGRLQALSIAWDARSKEEGGQRWFHLYQREQVTHQHELHWLRPSQNWNLKCADCHSTAVRRNYDAAGDRFETRWAELSVGCEACHGPASNHLNWAVSRSRPAREDSSKGLTINLRERAGVTWISNTITGKAARSRPRAGSVETEMCAHCHARRSQIADGYEPGRRFLDYYRPALVTQPLYHADGQQREEVYTWGSFVQSRMYAAGVTCSDCHNPHSGKLRATGNALCSNCHSPARYDQPEHHRHKAGSSGATCTSCHMPAGTYMGIDARHDHSLRVPRPDLSVKHGTPNACNSCHRLRDARWAAQQVADWYGPPPANTQATIAAAFANLEQNQLSDIASDTMLPAITRASALATLNVAAGRIQFDAAARGLHDADPLVRLGALQSALLLPAEARLRLVVPLLSDTQRALRSEAASVLASDAAQQLKGAEYAAWQRAASEYLTARSFNADRAFERVNLGTFLAERSDIVNAQSQLRAATRLERLYLLAYINQADVYRAQGRDYEAERVLRVGLQLAPGSALLHHALGLTLVRLDRLDAALPELAAAAAREPGNVRYAYVHAVALHSMGKSDAAIANLEFALKKHPGSQDILAALTRFHEERGATAQARQYADQLRALKASRSQ